MGFNKQGQLAIRGYQDFTAGTDLKQGFKLFILSEITGLELLAGYTFTKRAEFRRHDSYFKTVVASL